MSQSPIQQDWHAYIERAILDSDTIPIMGHCGSFDWKKFSNELGALLGLESLTLQPKEWKWLDKERILPLHSEQMCCLNFSVLPIEGKVSLLCPEVDINSLILWLTEHRSGSEQIVYTQFKKGFIAFLSTQVLQKLHSFVPFNDFLLRYVSKEDLPTSRCLSLPIQVTAFGETLSLRLLLPDTFQKSWVQHFSKNPPSLEQMELKHYSFACSLQCASFERTLKEFKEIQTGDFIPLPNLQIEPTSFIGSAYLNFGTKPLFRVRLKDKGFKILEHIVFEEGNQMMDDENFLDDEDFEEEEELSPQENEEMKILEEEPLEDESLKQNVTKDEVFKKITDVPIHVSVELARFNMSVSKLLQLKPGNLIELDIPPEKPVDLVVNGKKVGQGEIIRVGETLGLQITHLA